jgi:hypothetical protein
MALFLDFAQHSLLSGQSREELGCHSPDLASHSPSRVSCDRWGMSSVESFGWRSLLFARHSPGFGGREAEGKELEEEGMRSEEEGMELGEEGMPSEEETGRLALPFG